MSQQSNMKEALAEGVPIGVPLTISISGQEYLGTNISDSILKKQFFHVTGSQLAVSNFDPNLFMALYGNVSARTRLIRKFGKENYDSITHELRLTAMCQGSRALGGFTSLSLTEQRIKIQESARKKTGLLGMF